MAATHTTALEAVERDAQRPWDLILMDVDLPGMTGIDATRQIKHRWPDAKIIVLTVFEEPRTVLEAICAGADGYLLKSSSGQEILEQLEIVRNGGGSLTPGVARAVLDLVRDPLPVPRRHAAPPTRVELTPREQDVLRALMQGLAYKQVASSLDFARALGAARNGDADTASQAIERLEALQEAAAATSGYWAEQIEIQRLAAQAWRLHAQGRESDALEPMRRAAELEAGTDKHPVTPGEVLPAAELYGEMLLAAERPGEALTAYETALARSPNRLNGLFGAGRAAELAGDAQNATRYYSDLLALTEPADAELEPVRHARGYLAAIES